MDTKPNLYALFVGIDAYPPHIRQLTGCIGDIETFENYLQKYEAGNYNLMVQKRFNDNATRNTIINDFKTHLTKATAEDTIVFYFSGHGVQEIADTSIWTTESDGKTEGLALYDSVPPDFQTCISLADKELRYLLNYAATRDINGAAKKSPHIVVITDCCHSGENTRGRGFNNKIVTRFLTFKDARGERPFPQRAWNDFLFSNEINPNDLKTKPIDKVLPQAKYVAMAACQSNELAGELDGHGIFSKNLIEILERSSGVVTYRDLQNRIKNYIKNNYPQIPQIFSSRDTSDLFQIFLGKSGGSKPLYANVQFNGSEWMMDMGALHGISNQTKTIKIFSGDGINLLTTATINKISSDQTTLTLLDATHLDFKTQYNGVIEGFLSAPISVFIDNIDTDSEMENALRNIIQTKGVNLNIASNEDISDYAVRIFDGKYIITNRVDTDPKIKFKPIILPTDDINLTFAYLHQMSQFEYVKNLENSGANTLSSDCIDIKFLKPNAIIPEPIVNENGKEVVELAFTDRVHGELKGDVTVVVTSDDDNPLYVCLLYLSGSFGVVTNFFTNGVQRLENRNDKIASGDGTVLTFFSEPATEIFNLPATYSILKLIVSRQSFDVTSFEMADLPAADKLIEKMRGDNDRTIGTIKQNNAESGTADAWMTRTILIRNPNPSYDANYKNKPAKFDVWKNTAGGVFLEKLYLG